MAENLPRTPLLHYELSQFLEQAEVAPEILRCVAHPLLELYGLDDDRWLEAPETLSPEELTALLSFLHTARLLLAYAQLPEEARPEARRQLADMLIDADASLDEIRETEILLDELLAQAESVARHYPLPPLSFHVLLEQYACPPVDELDAHATGYGPDNLELPDALALFAQPVLERYLAEQPDGFEEAMNLASAYWVLAQTIPEHRERKIRSIQAIFASSPEEAAFIAREARRMIERFYTLFPEQQHRLP